ncbi:MAG: cbb3-type cytochrome c oxidase subunit 3 [Betaproteobacteria bacterium]|nr:cbb3-type cytochrome c oxidase subunit 3 [Betaproteobacteria bacterium]
MDINDFRSLVTVVTFAFFLGVVWWAYAPSRKARFERDGMLPFEEDGQPQSSEAGERS